MEYTDLYKFGLAIPEPIAWTPGKVFAREMLGSTPCLKVAAADEQVPLLKLLLERMPEPFWLLYVLVVPRGEGEPGRYQSSDSLDRDQICAFLTRFQNFLEADGRHNLWIKSESGPGLLVLDRHNLVYAYGFDDEWARVLCNLGWMEVNEESITLPDPHAHYYHEIFDDDARNLLAEVQWNHTPLREQDI